MSDMPDTQFIRDGVEEYANRRVTEALRRVRGDGREVTDGRRGGGDNDREVPNGRRGGGGNDREVLDPDGTDAEMPSKRR